MKKVYVFSLLLGLILSLQTSFAETSASSSDQFTELAKSKTWLKLLHFDRNKSFTEYRSAVDSDNFFFAPDGYINPKSELIATVQAMNLPFNNDKTHPRCDFPARTQWLLREGVIAERDDIVCTEFDEWLKDYGDGDIGLTFASGYLGNPASFFGHLLLHIRTNENSSNSKTASYLMDSSINFGADVPETDGMIAYMFKGLVGGYEARYSQAAFYRNNTIYSESQMRDSWLYLLELQEDERVFLIAHLYEIIGHDFDYLFLTQNCASRIARTLELVIDDDLTQSSAPWVSPEEVIRAAAPHASDPIYYPSRRKSTEHLFHNLTSAEQSAALSVWREITDFSLKREEFKALPDSSKAKVIDTLMSHALYLKQVADESELAQIHKKLLLARLELPSSSVKSVSVTSPTAPHEAQRTAKLTIGGAWSDTAGLGLGVQFRPLQYDLLESNDARMPFAALEILNLSFDLFDSELKLNQLKFFDVTNLNALQTRLPTDRTLAWQITGGVERNELACRDCYDANIRASAGQSRQVGMSTNYILIGLSARTTGFQDGPLASVIQAGTILDWSAAHRTLLSASNEDAYRGAQSRNWSLEFAHRWELSKRHELRFGVIRDRSDTQIRFKIARYL